MKNADYWAKRSEARMQRYMDEADRTLGIISRAYKQAQRELEENIQRIYRRVGNLYELTPHEVKELLAAPCGREEYLNILETLKGMPDSAARRALEARASSGAYAYRVSRLEALRDNVTAQCAQLAGVEEAALRQQLTGTIAEAYSRPAYDLAKGTGIGFPFAGMNEGAVEEILRNPWSGQHFSSRIWQNKKALESLLNETVTAGFMTGRSNAQTAKAGAEHMGVSFRAAERIVRTETAAMASQAEMESYNACGLEQYQYMALLDMKTSKICQKLDGQVFYVKDAQIGVNQNPMHPNCRSTTVGWFGEDSIKGMERLAKDPVTGESVLVPRNMTYEQWLKMQKETYGEERVAAARKAALNEKKDKAQYAEYKKVLGKKNAPESFAKFQEMKYTNPEAWERLQWDYRFENEHRATEKEPALKNGNMPIGVSKKLIGYALNPEHTEGRHKAIVFQAALGYNQSNANELESQIAKGLTRYKANNTGNKGYGETARVVMLVYGPKGIQPVETGWIYDPGQINPRMVTAYVSDKIKRP